ncbi:MAG: hypothetical protein Q4E53_14535 [Eubacteriales bacterium]|nr:hypothetical protein [Eubacteriales bacterium]
MNKNPKKKGPVKEPWYFTTAGIAILGYLTCSIYWFLGPFLKELWEEKQK